jgi:nicotinate-nucleotide pyrophosphorylase (carboxylating)
MLAEDLGSGDVTSEALIPPEVKARAEIIVNQSGVLAGVREAIATFDEVGVRARALKSDGQRVKAGEVIMRLHGPARGIFAAERVALNLLMHMSGIATATQELIDRAKKKNPKVIIAATRKTAPLLTYFDKRAVRVAGGEPHRYKLSDHILIKDGHLRLVSSVTKAVQQARKVRGVKVEVEVSKPEDALEAARARANVVMFDNMKPAEIKRAIRALERGGLRSQVTLEASGGINPSNVKAYAGTGVDIISSSHMIMRAPALDMGLELKSKGFKPAPGKKKQKSR